MSDSSSSIPSRRQALKRAVLLGGAVGVATPSAPAGPVTPSQTEGPFYPDADNDLTFVRSRDQRAQGDLIYVHGVVRDTEGQPVSRALVEIWQTDHQGIYNHAGDANHERKDPNFQSYGRCVTDEEGRYSFKTIKPKAYGDDRFMRTPHIHFKVWRRGYVDLTTQMYFTGEELNAQDGIYGRLSEDEQKLVTVTLAPIGEIDEPLRVKLTAAFEEKSAAESSRAGAFDITLEAV